MSDITTQAELFGEYLRQLGYTKVVHCRDCRNQKRKPQVVNGKSKMITWCALEGDPRLGHDDQYCSSGMKK